MARKPTRTVVGLPLQPLEPTGTVPVCSRSASPGPASDLTATSPLAPGGYFSLPMTRHNPSLWPLPTCP